MEVASGSVPLLLAHLLLCAQVAPGTLPGSHVRGLLLQEPAEMRAFGTALRSGMLKCTAWALRATFFIMLVDSGGKHPDRGIKICLPLCTKFFSSMYIILPVILK